MPARAAEVLFEEDQSFRQAWLWGLLSMILVFLTVNLALIVSGVPGRGDPVEASIGLGAGIAIVVGAAALMGLLKLSVRVDNATLHIRFFPLVRREIPLADIVRAEARTYRPILEYGGWGIRCGWKGMAYNVSGNRGVQLLLANGKSLLIGSQRADELAAALGQASLPVS